MSEITRPYINDEDATVMYDHGPEEVEPLESINPSFSIELTEEENKAWKEFVKRNNDLAEIERQIGRIGWYGVNDAAKIRSPSYQDDEVQAHR